MSVSSNYPAHAVQAGIGNPIVPEPTQTSAGNYSKVGSADSRDGFVDRRTPVGPSDGQAYERRQFGSSYSDLSPDARELALAIDQYKLDHRRRYITCEEMLMVIQRLGYSRSE